MKLPGVNDHGCLKDAINALRALGAEGGLIIAVWGTRNPRVTPGSNYATLLGTQSSWYWEDVTGPGGRIQHHAGREGVTEYPMLPLRVIGQATWYIVVPGRHTRFRSPIIPGY